MSAIGVRAGTIAEIGPKVGAGEGARDVGLREFDHLAAAVGVGAAAGRCFPNFAFVVGKDREAVVRQVTLWAGTAFVKTTVTDEWLDEALAGLAPHDWRVADGT